MKRLCGVALWLASVAPLAAQDSLPPYVREHFVRQDQLIPMRDGRRLFTTLYLPMDTARAYPVLLTRSPYGTDSYLHPTGPGDAFARAGYIFAFQDVRGRYRSEGTFVNMRPHREPGAGSTAIDETTDTWDTVDWLIKHVPRNNGRVGLYGISYIGYYATEGLIEAHPALKAVSPQAPVTVRPRPAHPSRAHAAGRVPHLQEGPPDHDSDPEQLVSSGRPESPAVPRHQPRRRSRLPAGYPTGLPDRETHLEARVQRAAILTADTRPTSSSRSLVPGRVLRAKPTPGQ